MPRCATLSKNFKKRADYLTNLPADLGQAIDSAWEHARLVPGLIGENEIRFLATAAACTPAKGIIVEIGSFKGKSTVGLATICQRYALGPVVAIDPHIGDLGPNVPSQGDTFLEFQGALKSAGVEANVEVHRAFSRDVAKGWNRPIRMLWIDGDHSYKGCKEDFDLFSPFLAEGGVIAFHDTLNAFEGPIRVLVEDVLRSDRFGSCGFVHSIAWAQYRPRDGATFRKQRAKLESRAAKLIPFVKGGAVPRGVRKLAYKLNRARVPRTLTPAPDWAQMVAMPNLEK